MRLNEHYQKTIKKYFRESFSQDSKENLGIKK
jgi:hypothetical protein